MFQTPINNVPRGIVRDGEAPAEPLTARQSSVTRGLAGASPFPVRWMFVALIVGCVSVAQAADSPRGVYFGTDVVPILTKLGCNGGGCHGKATGQNGFKLSLFGFEPGIDYDALVTDARGRRLTPAAPDRSLLLLKATSRVPHGGGRRLEESSDDYRILRDWIAQGATAPRNDDPQLVRADPIFALTSD